MKSPSELITPHIHQPLDLNLFNQGLGGVIATFTPYFITPTTIAMQWMY